MDIEPISRLLTAEDAVPPPVRFAQALAWWLKLGCISFGGPAGQIAIMHRELVERRRWISNGRFLHALNYCMLLPGPEAQQLATYIGWLMHGVKGGLAAGALFVLPSLLLLIGLSWVYVTVGASTSATLLYGVKPAVVAVVAFAAWRLGSKVLRDPILWAITGGAFLALMLHAPFPLVIATAALLGWLFRRRIDAASAKKSTAVSHGRSLIDDDTPTPAHALALRRRLAATVCVGLGFGALAFAALVAVFGLHSLPAQMARFFTQAALLTFGGAYAVMPYVFQGAVVTHGWLSASQMMDGLALGETTPGPLIMVVAFVGFVGGAMQGGSDALPMAITGACVATFFTFLPSFVFILAGAPLVESTRKDFRLAGILSAISAAVVGAILSLAVYFAQHVFWPLGLGEALDVFAVILAVAAWLALYRGWLGMVPVILLCAVTGGVWRAMT